MTMYIIRRKSIPSGRADVKIICPSMLCLAIILFSASPLAAECYPLQIGLYSPVQLVPKDKTICGVRLDLIWGDNKAVQGIDIGLVNGADSVQGIQIGGLNWGPRSSEKESWGLQVGLLANDEQTNLLRPDIGHASFTGVQIAGAFNYSDKVTGIQYALGNGANMINGIQIGFANGAGELNGLQVAPYGLGSAALLHGAQLGLINITGDGYGFQGGALNFAISGLSNRGRLRHGEEVDLSGESKSSGIVHGVQVGGLNFAHDVAGGQIGLLNICKTLKGVQVGLLNVVTSRFPDSGLFFSPVLNVGF